MIAARMPVTTSADSRSGKYSTMKMGAARSGALRGGNSPLATRVGTVSPIPSQISRQMICEPERATGIHRTVFELEIEGALYREAHLQRAYRVEPIRRLAENAGFEIEAVYDGFATVPANPRTERALSIIDDILPGIEGIQRCTTHVEPDRKSAIRMAVSLAEPGDTVLIAGKGHEDYQIIGHRKARFDDVQEATAALRNVPIAKSTPRLKGVGAV